MTKIPMQDIASRRLERTGLLGEMTLAYLDGLVPSDMLSEPLFWTLMRDELLESFDACCRRHVGEGRVK